MGDFSNQVHIRHDVLLKHLCGRNEVIEDTETENAVGFNSWHHGIQLTIVLHVLPDNASSSLTESESQKMADLHNSLFENGCLILVLFLKILFVLASLFALVHEGHDSCFVDFI